jgi:hypothetical protein
MSKNGLPNQHPLTKARSVPMRRASDVTSAMRVNDPQPYEMPCGLPPGFRPTMEHPPNSKRLTLRLKK